MDGKKKAAEKKGDGEPLLGFAIKEVGGGGGAAKMK